MGEGGKEQTNHISIADIIYMTKHFPGLLSATWKGIPNVNLRVTIWIQICVYNLKFKSSNFD